MGVFFIVNDFSNGDPYFKAKHAGESSQVDVWAEIYLVFHGLGFGVGPFSIVFVIVGVPAGEVTCCIVDVCVVKVTAEFEFFIGAAGVGF